MNNEVKTNTENTIILLSGIKVKSKSDSIKYQFVSDEDELLTETIKHCGGNKTKYKLDIIRLFKTYIDPSAFVCRTCSSEIIMAWKKYLTYYDKNNDLHKSYNIL